MFLKWRKWIFPEKLDRSSPFQGLRPQRRQSTLDNGILDLANSSRRSYVLYAILEKRILFHIWPYSATHWRVWGGQRPASHHLEICAQQRISLMRKYSNCLLMATIGIRYMFLSICTWREGMSSKFCTKSFLDEVKHSWERVCDLVINCILTYLLVLPILRWWETVWSMVKFVLYWIQFANKSKEHAKSVFDRE